MGEIISIPITYVYVQATTPADLTEGKIWYNTATNTTYVSDGSSYSEIVDVDLSYLDQQQLEQDINILINSVASSSTLNDYDDMFVDKFTDSNGALNTIDTGNTTAFFDTNKYSNYLQRENNWFKFENNFTDSGKDGDITLTNNGASFSSSTHKLGSYSLSVNNNYVAMTDFPAIDVANTKGSLFFWIYSESSSNHVIIQPSSGGVFLLSWGGGVGLSLRFGSTGTAHTDLSGAWHHLGVVWDNGSVQYYKDGTTWESEKTGQTGTTDTDYTIGKDSFNSYSQNYIDDFRLYEDCKLSSSEISALYNSGSGKEGRTLVGGTGVNAIIQTNAQTIESGFTHFMIVSNEETTGTGSVTYDISFDNGSNYQTGLESFQQYEIEDTGTDLILKQNLNAGASNGAASAYNWGVLLW
jgi:hypothetical protein